MARVKARSKALQRKSERADGPFFPSAILPFPAKTKVASDERAKRREARVASQRSEAKRLIAAVSVSEASKAFAHAIREAELSVSPDRVGNHFGSCTWPSEKRPEGAFDPLFVTSDARGRPIPRLTRLFAALTDERGGSGELEKFVKAVRAYPIAANKLEIVRKVRFAFKTAMRTLDYRQKKLFESEEHTFCSWIDGSAAAEEAEQLTMAGLEKVIKR